MTLVVNALCCGRRLKLGASGGPGLHVVQHGLKSPHVRGVGVGQLVREATVQTERLQLQPDETKAVLIKQDKEPRGALGAREAVSRDQACPIEAEMEEHQFINSLTDIHSVIDFALTYRVKKEKG